MNQFANEIYCQNENLLSEINGDRQMQLNVVHERHGLVSVKLSEETLQQNSCTLMSNGMKKLRATNWTCIQ